MALWLLVSAAYPVFLCVMLVKAVRHFRRARGPSAYGPSLPETAFLRERAPAFAERAAILPERRSASRTDDWTPSR